MGASGTDIYLRCSSDTGFKREMEEDISASIADSGAYRPSVYEHEQGGILAYSSSGL